MLDPKTVRAANYKINSADESTDEVSDRLGLDIVHSARFCHNQARGVLRDLHVAFHDAKAKQLRGEDLNDEESMLVEKGLDGESLLLSMLPAMFNMGMVIGHTAATEDLSEAMQWVEENPEPKGVLDMLGEMLGADIQVISVGPDGEATVVAGTSDLSEEEMQEIRKEARERFGNGSPLSEADKHRGM